MVNKASWINQNTKSVVMVTRGRTWRHRSKRKQISHPNILLDAEYIQLLKWAKHNGVDFKCLKPAIFQDTGRGMMATRKIKNGDCIITVPTHLLITTSAALKSDAGKPLGRMLKWSNIKLSRKCILCVYVVYLKHLGKTSFWFPYIATLPTDFNTPCYFNEDEIKALPESIHELCLSQIDEVQKAFDLIKQTYDKRFQDDEIDFLKFLTFDDFKWAWFIVNTRSVYLASGKEECFCCYGDCCHGDCYALAPVLDLLNHHDMAEVSAGFNKISQAYKIHTITEYQKHNQVFINYGPHDNTALLVEYGFILPRNIHNTIKFKPEEIFHLLKLPASSVLTEKMNLIKRNGLERDFSCSEDYGASWSLLAALRILALEEEMLSQWNKVLDGKPVSENNEKIVQKWIALMLTHSLTALENYDNCEQPDQTTNMKLALQLREQEKTILRTALSCIDVAGE